MIRINYEILLHSKSKKAFSKPEVFLEILTIKVEDQIPIEQVFIMMEGRAVIECKKQKVFERYIGIKIIDFEYL